MIISHEQKVEAVEVTHPSALNAAMKTLIGPAEGWEGYVMRIIELEENGYSPKHTHPWPHINFMIEGEGVLFMNGEETPVKAGSFAYVPSDELHQFKNTGKGMFRFICIVPEEGHQ